MACHPTRKALLLARWKLILFSCVVDQSDADGLQLVHQRFPSADSTLI
jgi:hypothetical protein